MFFKGEMQTDKWLNTTMLKKIRHSFDSRQAGLAIVVSVAVTSVQAGIFNAAEENAEVRKYDFSYSMQGEHKALPGQVFDDGKSTYFQFSREEVPVIFADDGNGVAVAPVKKQGIYLVVAGVHTRYMLQLGSVNAGVTYTGTRAIGQPGTAASKRPHDGAAAVSIAPLSNSIRNEMDILDQAKTVRSYPNRIEYAPKEDWDPVLPKINANANLTQSHMTKTKYSVPFVVGRDSLGPKGKSEMMKLLGVARHSKKIIIEGGSDGSTGKSSLGLKRGIAMSDWLVRNGVDKNAIYVAEIEGIQSGQHAGINFSSVIVTELDARTADVTTMIKPDQVVNATLATEKTVQKPLSVEGSFSVTRNEKGRKDPENTQYRAYEFPVGAPLNSEARTVISKYVSSSGAGIVMTDGSNAAYLKAKEIVDFIDHTSGFRPAIKTSGAPKGLILVKG